jgi:hypothetical protein
MAANLAPIRRTGKEHCMPTVRTRKPHSPTQARGDAVPRAESAVTVIRLILLVVAAVSVIGTSNYFAYMIGRKQATYEELRRQVDRVVHLMDQKQVEEQFAPITPKQQQDRVGPDSSGLIDMTTSTVNGKTTLVAPESAPPEKPVSAALIDAAPIATRETPPNAVAKHRDVAKHRASRGQKVPKAAPTEAFAQQPGQSTTAVPAPDAGAAGQ